MHRVVIGIRPRDLHHHVENAALIRGARVDANELDVSIVCHWFEDDFGGSEAGVIVHLRRYAGTPIANALDAIDRIDDRDSDRSRYATDQEPQRITSLSTPIK